MPEENQEPKVEYHQANQFHQGSVTIEWCEAFFENDKLIVDEESYSKMSPESKKNYSDSESLRYMRSGKGVRIFLKNCTVEFDGDIRCNKKNIVI